jgi:hypothetical protein
MAQQVPTQLCYRDGQLSSWGFSVNLEDETDPDLTFIEWFKVLLDPVTYEERQSKDPGRFPHSHQVVQDAYRDFFRELCTYIEKQLEEYVRSWRTAAVEFLFSVPTTWTAVSVINDFKRLAQEAGFGQAAPSHSVRIGLTEAEAAAVNTLKAQSVSYQVLSLFRH